MPDTFNRIATASRHPEAEIDVDRFERLLTAIGPVLVPDFLHRLIADLHLVQEGLLYGFSGPDWPALRTHSHVLIALAGTVGADRLQGLAETLNRVAHDCDLPEIPAMQDALLPLLGGLIGFIARRRDQICGTR